VDLSALIDSESGVSGVGAADTVIDVSLKGLKAGEAYRLRSPWAEVSIREGTEAQTWGNSQNFVASGDSTLVSFVMRSSLASPVESWLYRFDSYLLFVAAEGALCSLFLGLSLWALAALLRRRRGSGWNAVPCFLLWLAGLGATAMRAWPFVDLFPPPQSLLDWERLTTITESLFVVALLFLAAYRGRCRSFRLLFWPVAASGVAVIAVALIPVPDYLTYLPYFFALSGALAAVGTLLAIPHGRAILYGLFATFSSAALFGLRFAPSRPLCALIPAGLSCLAWLLVARSGEASSASSRRAGVQEGKPPIQEVSELALGVVDQMDGAAISSVVTTEEERCEDLVGHVPSPVLEEADRRPPVAPDPMYPQGASDMSVALSRFIPREFLAILNKESVVDLSLGDHVKRDMTIFFSDIRRFTNLSETLTPEENFKFINSYLSRMVPVIAQSGGFVDKYIGDAIMALFPEPGGADSAVKAAIEMQKKIVEYNVHRASCGYRPLSMGIGLHTGPLMLGIVGVENRMQNTVISDAVNLASRLESITKAFNISLAISEATFKNLSDPGAYLYRFIGKVRVKGKNEPVSVFEIFDGIDEKALALKMRANRFFEQGMMGYYQKDFSGALFYFKKVLDILPEDGAAAFYLDNCLMKARV